MRDFEFAKATEGMTAEEVLNYYRNLYHAESQSTEHGIVANALNDILPRMIVPPCKVGDTVYRTYGNFCGDKIYEGFVDQIIIDKNGEMRFYVYGHPFGFDLNNVGKTVFLTREAAEQALAERKVL